LWGHSLAKYPNALSLSPPAKHRELLGVKGEIARVVLDLADGAASPKTPPTSCSPAPPRPLDPINNPEYTRDILSEMAAHGATIISAYFLHKSLGHYLDNMQALAELHPPGGVA
jgi:hypothetical protein